MIWKEMYSKDESYKLEMKESKCIFRNQEVRRKGNRELL